MARVLHQIMIKQGKTVRYRKNKAALLMVFANKNHKAIAQVLQNWLLTDKPTISIAPRHKMICR